MTITLTFIKTLCYRFNESRTTLRCFSLILSKGLYLNLAYSTPGSVATSLPFNLENSLMVICERLFILRHNFK